MKRNLIFLPFVAACSHQGTWNFADASPDADASTLVTCETTTSCTLACDQSSSFATVGCEPIAPSRCVSSHDESEAYGCTLACDHEARIVEQCPPDTTP